MAYKFTIKGIRRLNTQKVNEKTQRLFSHDNHVDSISAVWKTPGDDELGRMMLVSEGSSTQGVTIKILFNDNIIVELPWYASKKDVQLCYAYLSAMKRIHRAARIMGDHDDSVTLTEDDMEADWSWRHSNMEAVLEKNEKSVLAGVVHDFYIDPGQYRMMADVSNIVDMAFSDFIALQWGFLDASFVKEERRHVSDDEELSSVRVIDNTRKVFIGACRYVGMMRENTCKMIEFDRFCALMGGQKEFRMMDAAQACLSPIDSDRWHDLFHAAEGIVIDCFRKTFIMRWNTDISNYQLSEFEDAMKDFHNEGFYYDWSIWDYQKAHIGDHFFMIRTGKGRNGIVMSGTIAGEPYPDEDWSGRGRRVYYIRLNLTHMIHPDKAPMLFTTGELSKLLPNFNWENGHSGELVDDSTADHLNGLFHHYTYDMRRMAEEKGLEEDLQRYFKFKRE